MRRFTCPRLLNDRPEPEAPQPRRHPHKPQPAGVELGQDLSLHPRVPARLRAVTVIVAVALGIGVRSGVARRGRELVEPLGEEHPKNPRERDVDCAERESLGGTEEPDPSVTLGSLGKKWGE